MKSQGVIGLHVFLSFGWNCACLLVPTTMPPPIWQMGAISGQKPGQNPLLSPNLQEEAGQDHLWGPEWRLRKHLLCCDELQFWNIPVGLRPQGLEGGDKQCAPLPCPPAGADPPGEDPCPGTGAGRRHGQLSLLAVQNRSPLPGPLLKLLAHLASPNSIRPCGLTLCPTLHSASKSRPPGEPSWSPPGSVQPPHPLLWIIPCELLKDRGQALSVFHIPHHKLLQLLTPEPRAAHLSLGHSFSANPY